MNYKGEYRYLGFWNCESKCNLEIYDNLVICSELSDNNGTSVTNMAEGLATLICKDFDINPVHLIWVEHYPEFDTYDLTEFNLDGNIFSFPRWKRINKEVVDVLKLQKLENKLIG